MPTKSSDMYVHAGNYALPQSLIARYQMEGVDENACRHHNLHAQSGPPFIHVHGR